MKISALNTILISLLLIGSALIYPSCKKSNDSSSDKNPNQLKITEGEFAGYDHTYSPNMGFWSVAAADVKYIHLVLGDNSNQVSSAPEVMDIVFYSGSPNSIHFPSQDGQWINLGLTFQGIVYYFGVESADLTITDLSDTHFRGTLQGDFVDTADSSRKISINVLIDIDMQMI